MRISRELAGSFSGKLDREALYGEKWQAIQATRPGRACALANSSAVIAKYLAIAIDKSPLPWYNPFKAYESVDRIMHFSLLPWRITKELPDLSPQWLCAQGIRLLMLDFDNTIVPYTTNVPTEAMENWLKMMLASPVQICVVSNSKRERVKIFCEKYGIPCITHAKKPFSKGIRECLAQFEIPEQFCALAGDQIYTDTLGANCAGIRSILVTAINNHNFWLKLRHAAEMPFILLAKKGRMII